MRTRDKAAIYLISLMLGSAIVVAGISAAMMPYFKTNVEALRRWQQFIVLDILVMAISAVLYYLAKYGYRRTRD